MVFLLTPINGALLKRSFGTMATSAIYLIKVMTKNRDRVGEENQTTAEDNVIQFTTHFNAHDHSPSKDEFFMKSVFQLWP